MGYYNANFGASLSRSSKDVEIDSLEALMGGEALFGGSQTPQENEELLGLTKSMIKMRRHREALFGNDTFADPSWDILLDLFASHLEKVRVSVSSACVAASAPATTGLRHLKALDARGFIRRVDDHLDKRRSYVELTHATKRMMIELISSHGKALAR